MYKDKAKQREAGKERVRRYRDKQKGVTNEDTMALGVTPDIILKLTDPFWRGRLAKICDAFEHSHHPRYKEEVWLGETNLSTACDYLECTG